MRNLKKVGCLILCLALMMSVAVFNVGAAFSDQKDIQHTEAVGMCTALNIIGGYPDGSYKPAGNITRAEMCKMICVALNGGNAPVLGTVTKHTFSDVQTDKNSAWAEPYIESCYTQGIVSGIGGGLFNPSGSITGSQAAKMLLVALGYQSNKETFTGASWELNVNVRASNRGLYKELDTMNPSAALTRDNAAQMIWNALQADEVEYKTTLTTDANGQLVSTSTLQDKVVGSNSDKIDLMTDKYKTIDTDYTTGTLYQFSYSSSKKEFTYYLNNQDKKPGGDKKDGNGNTVVDSFKSKTDYTAMVGQHVRFVAKDTDNVYGAYADDSKVVLTGKIGDLPDFKTTNATDKSFKVSGTKYTLEKAVNQTPVYVFTYNTDYAASNTYKDKANADKVTQVSLYQYAGAGFSYKYDGDTKTDYIYADKTSNDAFNFTAVDYDGNGDIDFFMVTPFQVAKVNYVSGSDFKIQNLLTNAQIGSKFTKGDADVSVYDGMAKNDYVVYTSAENTPTNTDTFTQATTVSGKISTVDDPDVSIDGTWYSYDNAYKTYKGGMPSSGTTLTDAVVANGYIFYADSVNKKNVSDYAVICAIQPDANNVSGAQAKLLFTDGTKQVVDLKYDYATAIAANDPDNGTAKENYGYNHGSVEAKVGDLVTYTKNSDAEYTLTYATTADVDYDVVGQYSYTDASNSVTIQASKTSNSSDKSGYINKVVKDSVNGDKTTRCTIQDSAVIFVKYDTNSYKVISGAEMKKINYDQFVTNFGVGTNALGGAAFLLGTKQSGNSSLYDVTMAYMSMGSNDVSDSDTYYGYVTANVQNENSDNQLIRTYTLWNGTDYVQVNTDTSVSITGDKFKVDGSDVKFDTLPSGSVIEYKMNSDKVLTEIVNCYDMSTYSAFTDESPTGKSRGLIGVVGLDSASNTLDFKTVAAAGRTNVGTTSTNADGDLYEVDSDTQYIYIDTSSDKMSNIGAADVTSVPTAQDYSDQVTYAGALVPNAFVIADKDGTVKLIVSDINGDIMSR